jgi:hypothetical protein
MDNMKEFNKLPRRFIVVTTHQQAFYRGEVNPEYEFCDIVMQNNGDEWIAYLIGIEKEKAEFICDALNSYIGR